MEQTIDLAGIMEAKKLNKEEIARDLFPNTKYPVRALERVMAGISELDANQILRLSISTGISLEDLFHSSEWKAKFKNRVHTFTNGNRKIELDVDKWTANLWENGEKIHGTLLVDKLIPLNEFLQSTEKLFNKTK